MNDVSREGEGGNGTEDGQRQIAEAGTEFYSRRYWRQEEKLLI